jgi:hypothetical protein
VVASAVTSADSKPPEASTTMKWGAPPQPLDQCGDVTRLILDLQHLG